MNTNKKESFQNFGQHLIDNKNAYWQHQSPQNQSVDHYTNENIKRQEETYQSDYMKYRQNLNSSLDRESLIKERDFDNQNDRNIYYVENQDLAPTYKEPLKNKTFGLQGRILNNMLQDIYEEQQREFTMHQRNRQLQQQNAYFQERSLSLERQDPYFQERNSSHDRYSECVQTRPSKIQLNPKIYQYVSNRKKNQKNQQVNPDFIQQNVNLNYLNIQNQTDFKNEQILEDNYKRFSPQNEQLNISIHKNKKKEQQIQKNVNSIQSSPKKQIKFDQKSTNTQEILKERKSIMDIQTIEKVVEARKKTQENRDNILFIKSIINSKGGIQNIKKSSNIKYNYQKQKQRNYSSSSSENSNYQKHAVYYKNLNDIDNNQKKPQKFYNYSPLRSKSPSLTRYSQNSINTSQINKSKKSESKKNKICSLNLRKTRQFEFTNKTPLNFYEESIFVGQILDLCNISRRMEEMKINLIMTCKDFNLIDGYKFLQINAGTYNDFFTQIQLRDALMRCGVRADRVEMERMYIFFKRFNKSNDNYLSFSDFTQAILPVNLEMQTLLKKRLANKFEIQFEDYVIEKYLNMLDAVIDTEAQMEAIRKKLKARKDFDICKAFHTIFQCNKKNQNQHEKQAFITGVNIKYLMKKHRQSFQIDDEDIRLIISRFDRDNDGKISSFDFYESMVPSQF